MQIYSLLVKMGFFTSFQNLISITSISAFLEVIVNYFSPSGVKPAQRLHGSSFIKGLGFILQIYSGKKEKLMSL